MRERIRWSMSKSDLDDEVINKIHAVIDNTRAYQNLVVIFPQSEYRTSLREP